MKTPQSTHKYSFPLFPPSQSQFSLEQQVYTSFKSSYSLSPTFYYIKIINEILCNSTSHLVSSFKEYLINDDISEFLQSYFPSRESSTLLPNLLSYYETSSLIFPNYTALPESKFIYKNIQRKQRIIDFQQQEEEKEKYKTKEIKVFNSEICDSILNVTNTSVVQNLMGIKEYTSERDCSCEKVVNMICKAEDESKDGEMRVINCSLKKKREIVSNKNSYHSHIIHNYHNNYIKGRNWKNMRKENNVDLNTESAKESEGLTSVKTFINWNNEIRTENENSKHKHNNSTNGKKGVIDYLLASRNNKRKEKEKEKEKNFSINNKKKKTKSISPEMKINSITTGNYDSIIKSAYHKKNNPSAGGKLSIVIKNMISKCSKSKNSVYRKKLNDFEKTTMNNDIFNIKSKIPLTSREKEIIKLGPELKKLLNSKLRKMKAMMSISHKKNFTISSLVTSAVSYNNKETSNDKPNAKQKENFQKQIIESYSSLTHPNRNIRFNFKERLTKANTSSSIKLKSPIINRRANLKEESKKFSLSPKTHLNLQSINIFVARNKYSNLVLGNQREIDIKGINIKGFEDAFIKAKYKNEKANSERKNLHTGNNVTNGNNGQNSTSSSSNKKKNFCGFVYTEPKGKL